jgi:hypothetical protein
MSVSSGALSWNSTDQAGPDFLEFLGEELNANSQEALTLLGRWLLEYRPLAPREICVLESREPRELRMHRLPVFVQEIPENSERDAI